MKSCVRRRRQSSSYRNRLRRGREARTLRVEPLEARRLLAYAVGTNLISNPGAELGLTGWVTTDPSPTTRVYGSSGDLPSSANGAPGGGTHFFWGGTDGNSTIQQNISLSGGASQIDLGLVEADLSAWMGGYDSQNDHVQLEVHWLNGSGGTIRVDQAPTVLASDRGGVTKMLFRGLAHIPVPVGTRSVVVALGMIKLDGAVDNDASADNISLVLSESSIGGGASLTEDVHTVGTLNIETEPGTIQWTGDVTGNGTVHIGGDGTVEILGNFSPGTLIIDTTVKAKPSSSVNVKDNIHVQDDGVFAVEAGTLAVADGVIGDIGSDIVIDGNLAAAVQTQGEISGTGTVGTLLVQTGGTASPGSSPGRLTTGNLTMNSGSRLRIELNGTSGGTTYDELLVRGSVNLNNPTLIVSRGFSPSLGQSFVVLRNDGTDRISGTFAGLSEGEAFNIAGQRFHISYKGGTGNDVELRRNRRPGGSNAGKTVNEDTTLNSSVSRSDPDGDGVSVELVSGPSHASSFSLNSSGSFSYRADAHYSGGDSFRYRVTDGELTSSTYTVSINVTPVADAPTLSVQHASGPEGAHIPLKISSGLVDADGSESLSLEITGVPAGVTLSKGTNQGGGKWSLSPSQLSGLTINVPDDASFSLAVKATARESANGVTASTTRTLNVNVGNADPVLASLPDLSIEEGDFITLPPAAFTDAGFDNPAGGTQENFTATIDWGDGHTEPAADINLTESPGSNGVLTTGTINATHAYADDGTYTVTVTVHDDNGGSATRQFDVQVANTDPVLATLPDLSIEEGDFITLPPATFTDAGFDNPAVGTAENFNATIDWGDGHTEPAADITLVEVPGGEGVLTTGTIDATHAYGDDGTYTVTVTVYDDNGGSSTQQFDVTVGNVDPTVHPLVGPNPSPAVRGQTLFFSGTFSDPGFDNPVNPDGSSVETFTYRFNWGDGTPDSTGQATVTNVGGENELTLGAFADSHIYTTEGPYLVTATITDDNSGATSVTTTFTVHVAAMQGDNLAVGGHLDRDRIVFSSGDTPGDVELELNGELLGVYRPTGKLLAFGQDGDDSLQVAGNIDLPAWLYGDGGDDRVKGGRGHDVILGGPGDDLLVGGRGNDLIIGGLGGDRIVGNSDDDILISGYTAYDYRSDGRLQVVHEEALSSIMDEWTDHDSGYAARRQNVMDGTGLANGFFLRADKTVSNDDARDMLTGSAGLDWFFANLDGSGGTVKDKITDLDDEEFADDLDFILAVDP